MIHHLFRLRTIGSFLLTVTCLSSLFAASPQISWNDWVKQLRAEAIQQGIHETLFDQVFSHIKAPSPQVLRFDRIQPEKKIAFLKYRTSRADAYRIKVGRREYQKNKEILEQVGQQYGVSPCFIASLWGLESSYGTYLGTFPVMQSLATLAYDTRRSDFFRQQIFHALHILDGGHVTLSDFKGEWAGASGHPQFLPSSWHNYAVDQNGDGKKDIWHTLPDVFGSIANYLAKNGWQKDQPWAMQVSVPPDSKAATLMNTKTKLSVAEWRKLDLQLLNNRSWPDEQLQAELIRPDGGPDFLIFNNFNVIMKWNRSNYYAGTVGYLAEQICQRPL